MTAALPFTAPERFPGAHSSWPRRRAALGELASAGWPTRRREAWRYTDLEPLAHAGLELAPPPPGSSELDAASAWLAADSDAQRHLVLLDGRLVPELCSPSIAGLQVCDLEADWPAFEARFADRIAAKDHPLATLNTAFVQGGVWLRVPAQQAVAEIVHVHVLGSARSGLATQPRLLIELERGARLTLFVDYADVEPGAGWVNSVIQTVIERDATLEIFRLQRQAETRTHTSLLAAELKANAALTAAYVDAGGRLVRNDVDVRLQEPGAAVDLFGLFLAGANQHVDDHLNVVHAAPSTRSRQAFRGIIGERGRGVFNGRVLVQPGAQRIEARQSNDNLLLGPRAEVDTKPELEIYADDVQCSHGSTVGELDVEQLFYLRTRGIDAVAARELLTQAFAADVLDAVRDKGLRARLLGPVTERLNRFAQEAR